jgi:RHS repeat-associated protein
MPDFVNPETSVSFQLQWRVQADVNRGDPHADGSLTDNQSFCYDALDRLVWAGNSGSPSGGDHCGNAPSGSTTPTYQQSFSYDNLDRMTSGPSGMMSYDPNHVHAADSASSFPNQYASYDAMGNMTCRNVDTGNGHTCGSGQTGVTMTYDNEGRLASWTAPSGTTATDSFLYDNEGNRVLQRTSDSNGITDTITFDSYLETVIHNGTTTTTKYYSVGGQRVAMRIKGTLTNPLYYLVNDMQGGTSLVLTSGGGVQAVQLYAPYGAVRYSQGTVPTTYNYTGQRLDSETGLLYYGFRYYDPVTGQFVRADTVETNARGMDGYAYVGENPETLNDPTGHFIVGSGNDDGTGNTRQQQQQYDYHYATSPDLGESGLPALLDMYLYHHDVWVLVESYAQQQLHSSTRMLLAMEAIMLLHTKGLNWNANDTMRHLFLQVNALALPVAVAAAGLGVDGGEMATAEDLEQVAAESEQALAENVAEDAGGPCSFTSATLVTTEHGKQAIGTLQVGEEVLAYNPMTHKMEEEPILHVWINQDHDLVDLTLTTIVPGQHGKPSTKTSEVIHTNQKHPFFTEEKGFLPVGQITLGMHVLQADGSYGMVTGWRSVSGTSVMYNLEVAQDHTFTVGTGQWVVHNSGGGSCGGLTDGMKMSTNDALDAAQEFLGEGYKDLGNGRFVLADGRFQVRMGDSDILGWHGGGPHMNFERLEPNPARPGKMMIVDNMHIYLDDGP